jgi:hypothetical protein
MKALFLILSALVVAEISSAQTSSTGPLTAYSGMCDASAAVALDRSSFAVANDEDNVVRIYSADQPGPPRQAIDLNRFLEVDHDKPETDFEGATWLGDRIYWVTSHGRNRDGKYRESRHRFFAMHWQTNANAQASLVPIGRPYHFLLEDLLREPRLRPFGLPAAAKRQPKARGGLNIEGLCATPTSNLLIGFRNPIPNGQALIVPLLNPEDLVEGRPARFGDPLLLDLGKLGIRDMVQFGDGYLIVAGAYGEGGTSVLYRWGGPGTTPTPVPQVDLQGTNPEAIIAYPGRTNVVQLLSDDGTCRINGILCKQLKNPAQRQFRSVWVNL